MRYVQVTHQYSVPVPDAAPSDPEWDTLCNSAMTIMEGHMQRLNPNMKDLRTSWETMPKVYDPIENTEQTGTVHRGRMPTESELIRMQTTGVNFVDDIMGGVGGVQKPHDVGQRFFPPDHPLYDAETEIIKGEPKQIEDAEIVEEDEE